MSHCNSKVCFKASSLCVSLQFYECTRWHRWFHETFFWLSFQRYVYFWRYDRRVLRFPCTPWLKAAVLVFKWFDKAAQDWGVWWVWGYGFSEWLFRRQKLHWFSFFTRTWLLLFSWYVYEYRDELCRMCLRLKFYLDKWMSIPMMKSPICLFSLVFYDKVSLFLLMWFEVDMKTSF